MAKRKPSEVKADAVAKRANKHLHLSKEDRAKYLNPAQQMQADADEDALELLTAENSAHVNDLGRKIARLREKMVTKGKGEEFARFRFAGRYAEYSINSYFQEGASTPGGVYMQPEDEREAFIDEKMRIEGVV